MNISTNTAKRSVLAALLLVAVIFVSGCEASDYAPTRDCEFLCGDDWMDPVQSDESTGAMPGNRKETRQ